MTKAGTVRERIAAIQAELESGKLLPETARESQAILTAMFGRCLDELRHAELAYTPILLAAYREEAKANRATLVAECTTEFRRLREAKDATKLVEEMLRTCRKHLESLSAELRMTR